jgi:hypothetical protein
VQPTPTPAGDTLGSHGPLRPRRRLRSVPGPRRFGVCSGWASPRRRVRFDNCARHKGRGAGNRRVCPLLGGARTCRPARFAPVPTLWSTGACRHLRVPRLWARLSQTPSAHPPWLSRAAGVGRSRSTSGLVATHTCPRVRRLARALSHLGGPTMKCGDGGHAPGLSLWALGAQTIDDRAEEHRDHRDRREVRCNSQSTPSGRDRVPQR